MKIVLRHVLVAGYLLCSLGVTGQVSQDLIDKAKAAGMTDAQIQQEMSKRLGQTETQGQPIGTTSDTKITDRVI